MIHKLHPLTITDKLTETADFYKTFFNFNEVFTSDWYIQLAHESGAEIAVMSQNSSNQPDFLQAAHGGSGILFTLETDNAGQIYEELRSKEAPIIYDLKDEEWGQRHFILQDPSGVYVDVVQYL